MIKPWLFGTPEDLENMDCMLQLKDLFQTKKYFLPHAEIFLGKVFTIEKQYSRYPPIMSREGQHGRYLGIQGQNILPL